MLRSNAAGRPLAEVRLVGDARALRNTSTTSAPSWRAYTVPPAHTAACCGVRRCSQCEPITRGE
eukprot:2023071-Pyramimonas_sp.AAC.1